MKPYYESPPRMPRVRLFLGDSPEIVPIVATPSKRLLVHADPPYGKKHTRGISRSKKEGSARQAGVKIGGGRPKNRAWKEIRGDAEPFDPTWLLAYPRLVLWGADHYCARLPDDGSWIVWDKREDSGQDDGSDNELAWSNLGGARRTFRHLWRGVCRASETGVKHLAPTQKPEALVGWILDGRGRAKPLVGEVDAMIVPYAGSGPEVVPALDRGLEVIACDVDAGYLDTIVTERIEPWIRRREAGRAIAALTPKVDRQISMGW